MSTAVAPELERLRAAGLPPALAGPLAAAARLAAGSGVEVYVVGGTARDLLSGRPVEDLDLAVEGDAAGFARRLGDRLGAAVEVHADFGTATLRGAALPIDVAATRRESYPRPAALPEVRPAPLALDLARRDFTVNALALPLGGPGQASGAATAGGERPAAAASDRQAAADGPANLDQGPRGPARLAGGGEAAAGAVGSADRAGDGEPAWGQTGAGFRLGGPIDPHHGLADLRAGRLRVLHDRSFVDDPTRILRGVRLEDRLGLRFDPATEQLARRAAAEGAFGPLSADRLRAELELLLESPGIHRPFARLEELGVLAVLHPRLALGRVGQDRLRRADEVLAWWQDTPVPGPPVRAWRARLLALARSLDREGRVGLAGRCGLAGELAAALADGPDRVTEALAGLEASELPPHRLEDLLEKLGEEELTLALAEADGAAAGRLRRYLLELRPLRLAIGGDDLIAAGWRPGPALGAALRATRRARLDGEIGAADELAFARRWLEAHGAPRGANPSTPGNTSGDSTDGSREP